jgi:F-type H+-transporting ATPase subunit gamma
LSGVRAIEHRLRTLAEIGEVMSALKNLALVEVARLRRFAPAQQRVVQTVEAATADLLAHFPQPAAEPAREVFLLIGSERGFCGNYNETVAAEFARRAPGDALVVVVGRRLAMRLGRRVDAAAVLEGPSVAEEVASAITRLVAALERLPVPPGMLLPALTVLSQGMDEHGGEIRSTRPFAPKVDSAAQFSHPPHLNLDPFALFRELADHYLFAVLHGLFYSALLAENEHRLQHLEGALRRIERTRTDLALRRNALRQEEITEDIEVILLSAAAASEGDHSAASR